MRKFVNKHRAGESISLRTRLLLINKQITLRKSNQAPILHRSRRPRNGNDIQLRQRILLPKNTLKHFQCPGCQVQRQAAMLNVFVWQGIHAHRNPKSERFNVVKGTDAEADYVC
jgi:hypothetical protein